MTRHSDKFRYYAVKDSEGVVRAYRNIDKTLHEPLGELFMLTERPSNPIPATGTTFHLKER